METQRPRRRREYRNVLVGALDRMADALLGDPRGAKEADVRTYVKVFAPAHRATSGRLVLEQLVDTVAQGARVLEVGCGPGLDAEALAQVRSDLQVVATDLDPRMVAFATRRTASLRHLDFRQCNATSLPFADSSFDVTFSSCTLSMIDDRQTALAEIVRVTRTGGLILIVDYAPWVPWKVAWQFGRRLRGNLFQRLAATYALGQDQARRARSLEHVANWLASMPVPLTENAVREGESAGLGRLPFWVALTRRR